jgi:hypothetical protein
MQLTYAAEWQDVDANAAELTIGPYSAEVYYSKALGCYCWHVDDADGTTFASDYAPDDSDARYAAEQAISAHHSRP